MDENVSGCFSGRSLVNDSKLLYTFGQESIINCQTQKPHLVDVSVRRSALVR